MYIIEQQGTRHHPQPNDKSTYNTKIKGHWIEFLLAASVIAMDRLVISRTVILKRRPDRLVISRTVL